MSEDVRRTTPRGEREERCYYCAHLRTTHPDDGPCKVVHARGTTCATYCAGFVDDGLCGRADGSGSRCDKPPAHDDFHYDTDAGWVWWSE